MHVCHGIDERETKAGSRLSARRIHTLEALYDEFARVLRDTGPGIHNSHIDGAIRAARNGECDGTAFGRVLHGIVEQV